MGEFRARHADQLCQGFFRRSDRDFFETTTAINKFVGERVIDLGFLRMEGEIGPGIDVERLAPGKSVCVVREDHPLAALDEITVKDLRKHSAHSDRPAAIPSSIRVWLPNEKVHT